MFLNVSVNVSASASVSLSVSVSVNRMSNECLPINGIVSTVLLCYVDDNHYVFV